MRTFQFQCWKIGKKKILVLNLSSQFHVRVVQRENFQTELLSTGLDFISGMVIVYSQQQFNIFIKISNQMNENILNRD